MPQPPDSIARASKGLRVGLVAGAQSLQNLGPVVRHMLVALLDEPMPMSLICPAQAEAAYVPETLVQPIRYGPMRLPYFRTRSLEALAEQAAGARVGLLHALDEQALPVTRRLAARMDLGYLVGAYSLSRELRALDERRQGLLAAAEPIRRGLCDWRVTSEEAIRLLRPGVHPVRNATCFMDPSHAVAIVAAGELNAFRPFAAAMEVFAHLRRSGRECAVPPRRLRTGGGDLRRFARTAGLMADLTFVEHAQPEELTRIVQVADIFIAPQASRRVDVELLAAMAGGVPVLAAAGGPSDFIIPDQTALVFAAGDASQLAMKLQALLDDRAAARALAENALAHLRKFHSPAQMGRDLAGIYRRVLGMVPAGA